MKRKMKKTLSWILSLTLVLVLISAVGGTALAAGEITETEIADWSALVANTAITQVSENGDTTTITLNGCVMTTGTLQVPSGKAYTLDLNGYGIRYGGEGYASVIYVTDGAKLTLKDSSSGRAMYYIALDKTDKKVGRGAAVTTSAPSGTEGTDYVAVTGGYVTGGMKNEGHTDWANREGGGIFVNSGGIFNMTGGTVAGNMSDYKGGGVFVRGEFTMAGGIVCNNRSNYGGGVVADAGAFTMSGGMICDNTGRIGGGGVYVGGYGKFTLNGGTISGNHCTNDFGDYGGGGVMIFTNGNFKMTGGTITDNTAQNGGGVGIITSLSSSGRVEISGGTIRNNNARASGGGVYSFSGKDATKSFSVAVTGDVSIVGNSAATGGGVCIMDEDCSFSLTGGTITGNNATNGGGIYVEKTKELKTSGSPTVTRNKETGGNTDSNLCLSDGETITVIGALSDRASLGITAEGGADAVGIAAGGDGYTITADDAAKVFFDNNASNLYQDGGGQLWLLGTNPSKYIVGFNANGGSAVMSQVIDSGSMATRPEDPTREGYAFDQWYADSELNGAFDFTAAITANTTIYAGWTGNPYTVSFDANGGEGTMNPQSFTYGKAQALAANTFTNGSYRFSGWNTKPDGSGTGYAGRQTVRDLTVVNNGTVTLYAQWTNASTYYYVPTYPVSLPVTEHGALQIEPAEPQQGQTVTVTALPKEWYQLAELTATDEYGNEVRLTTQADGSYSFTQPGSTVTLTSSFRRTFDAFTDLQETSWYARSVYRVLAQDIMRGVGQGLFAPHEEATRAMAVTVLYGMAGKPEVAPFDAFPDVAAGKWYTNGILWGAAQGIISGYPDGTFGTSDAVTREQMATLLWNYAGKPTATANLSGFTDANEISAYARDAMNWAVSVGIINGRGGRRLAPKASATRAEVAQIMMKYDLLGE